MKKLKLYCIIIVLIVLTGCSTDSLVRTTQITELYKISNLPYDKIITVELDAEAQAPADNLNVFLMTREGLGYAEWRPISGVSYISVDIAERLFLGIVGDISYTLVRDDEMQESITVKKEQYPINQCVRRVSENRVYTIHKTKSGNLIYVFYSKDKEGLFTSEKEAFFASKSLTASDFSLITEGCSLLDVIGIDASAQEVYDFRKKTVKQDSNGIYSYNYTSKHITKDGVCIITYDPWNEVDNFEELYGGCPWNVEPKDLKIKSIEWSDPLPILEQDLPK